MIPMEIERKFSMKYLPEEIQNVKKIVQKHVYRDDVCSIRVRKCEDFNLGKTVCTHTIKAKGEDMDRHSIYELEKEITEEEFEIYRPFEGGIIIEKYRLIVPLNNNLKAEVDIFEGEQKGLAVVEVEFESEEQAENFELPDWFNEELSYGEFSNRKISAKTNEEIIELIGEEQVMINEKIYEEFKIVFKQN